MTKKNKPVNMNVRMKDNFRHLSLYLSPAQMTYQNQKKSKEKFVTSIAYTLGNQSLVFSFHTFDEKANEFLHIDDQLMSVSFIEKDDKGETTKFLIHDKSLSYLEAKEFMKNLFDKIRENNPFWYHDNGVKTGFYVSMPKLMNFIFDVEYSNEDTEKLLNLLEDDIKEYQGQSKKLFDSKNEKEKAKEAYTEEFEALSNQKEIDKLKKQLFELEAKESKLKKDLKKKHKVTHSNNVNTGYQAQSAKKTENFMQKASEIIKDNQLNVDFGLLCSKCSIR